MENLAKQYPERKVYRGNNDEIDIYILTWIGGMKTI